MSVHASKQEIFSPAPDASYPPSAHFVAGDWCEAEQGGRIDSIDPATEQVHAQLAAGSAADLDRAVAAAQEAFANPKWRRMVPAKRAKILWRMAELIDEHRANLALLESLDTGKTAFDAGKIEIPMVAEIFRYYAGWVTKLEGGVVPLPGNAMGLSLREPVGVCGLITPWNFPLLLAAWKIAPALACGNAVVIKPSELTSLTTLWLAKLGAEAGLPPGALNVVTGDGESVGAPMVEHPGIDKISFTGSTAVGKSVQRGAAETLKRVTLELGGKSPNIVFADADLKAATRGAIGGIFYNKGEVCAAGSRVLVQHEVYEDFVGGLKAIAEKTTVGPPRAEGTRMGPVCNAAQFDKVRGYIQRGQEEGARLVAGGRDLRDEVGGGKGYYVEPTVFADVDPAATIAQEEIFGPVLSIIGYEDEEDAIRIANDSEYGLSGGVWSSDNDRAIAVAKRLRTGQVDMNGSFLNTDAPFGGYKKSGNGRELGRYGLAEFLEAKQINLPLG